MNNIFNNAPISVSVIDYLGKMDDGVGMLLSIVSDDTVYELAYWFDKIGRFRLVPEQKLLDKLELSDIYEYKYINEFIYFIHNNIGDTDKILEQFLK